MKFSDTALYEESNYVALKLIHRRKMIEEIQYH